MPWAWLRAALLSLIVTVVTVGAAQARPVTLFVGKPSPDAILYGPADMLCDLNKCRLFELPASLHLVPGTIVEFGLPAMGGQDRIDLRRCFQVCRAGVLGYQSPNTSPPGQSNPTIAITPIEIRLE